MKLWEGRFKKQLAEQVNDFNSSIRFDCRMYAQDIQGSIAHATMLSECGIISQADKEQIIAGLQGILADVEAGTLAFDSEAEDIHMFVEAELTKRIGDAGKRLHTARSRNDQVALDFRLYTREEIANIQGLIYNLCTVIYDKASEHEHTIMPGYTHLQRAQPVSFAHTLLAYEQMFLRDYSRLADCLQRMDVMPLGAGALAGTTYPINRERTAELLGFAQPSANSIDAVSDRDFAIELLSDLSIIMMHLSRFSEDMVLWCSQEFAFVELDDAFATGSSIMPQKKNPDIAELVRGKTGRVYGDLITLLTVMKSLPLAYNKDMQEDKEALFDAIDTAKVCLDIFADMLRNAHANAANMRAASGHGFINATDCADYLAKKGIPFREAYKITGELVAICMEQNTTLEELPLAEYQKLSDVFADDVYQAVNLDNCLNDRNAQGGPGPQAVRKQLEGVKARLEEIQHA